jgi:hypothetical protein
MYVRKTSKKRRREEEKSRELILQKKGFLSPVLSSVFHSHSAEFLQQVVSLILLCFAYLFYCPWSVSCWKIQPTKDNMAQDQCDLVGKGGKTSYMTNFLKK